MPIKHFEDVPGRMMWALEEAGHGSRIIIADRSLDIDSSRQRVVDYRGRTSPQALRSCLKLVRHEGLITFMAPDVDDEREEATLALVEFGQLVTDLSIDPTIDITEQDFSEPIPRLGEDGFKSLIAPEAGQRQIVVRTPDDRPYACATFIVGHSQFCREISDF
ncbi:MAG TPA: hypothetical protein VIH90_04110 [Candidatus Saccharimonadales bacterium]